MDPLPVDIGSHDPQTAATLAPTMARRAAFTADDGHQWADIGKPAGYRMNASADQALGR